MEIEAGLSASIGGYPQEEYIGYVVHRHVKHFILYDMGLVSWEL